MFYEAIYLPKETEKLSEEARKCVGTLIGIQEGGKILKGPHKGEPSYIPASNFGVIPNVDLQEIRSIPYGKWKEYRRLAGRPA